MLFVNYYLLLFVTLSRKGIIAKMRRETRDAARNISRAGTKRVVIVSAPPSVRGVPTLRLIQLPMAGPASIGMSTEKIIRTP